MHTICAFANDIDNWGGGYVVIGIEEENGMPVFPIKGIEKESVDSISKDILQKCNLIQPRYIPVVESCQYDGKTVLVLWAPGGDSRPYKCPVHLSNQKSDSAFYIRKLTSTIKANDSETKELFQLSETILFDDRANMHAEIGDMKFGLISDYLYLIKSSLYSPTLDRSIMELATDLRLVSGPVEMKKPINVGLMFFNDQPEQFFPYARIEIIEKPDPTGAGMREQIFTGPLDVQLSKALNHIKSSVIAEKVYKVRGQAEALRYFNYPYEAVEEALSNAVYHKSYQIGEPITVTITPESMEITSLPGPDRAITDENLRECKLVSRRYRNRRIGDFLKELHLVEGRNTGVPTMLRAMERNGSERPEFLTDEDRTYFTVILPVHRSFLNEKNQKTQIQSIQSHRRKSRTPQELRVTIVDTLRKYGSMSKTELSHAMGYQKATDTITKAVKKLISEGILHYSDNEHLRSRNQRLILEDTNHLQKLIRNDK